MCSAKGFSEQKTILVNMAGVSQTMLGTLYGRALDAESTHPILGDTFAQELVSKLDYDWRRTAPKGAALMALRTAHFDTWARQFLAVHARATVLHLGCGLDSRVFRLSPGPGVEWYDVDYPEVIALREQLYPSREHYHLVSASVTDHAWLAAIPSDRPALLIAEGLTMYLHEEDGAALLRRVVDRFPSGELQFDTFNWLGIKGQKRNAVIRGSGAKVYWVINGPDDILRLVPRLRVLSVMPAGDSDTFRQALKRQAALYRFAVWLSSLVPAVRGLSQYHRYAF